MVRGGLFSRYFLEDGVRDTPSYRGLDPALTGAFAAEIRTSWQRIASMPRPNEAETEAEFIFPMLDRLGWSHLPQQEPGRGRRDVADALLFLRPADKEEARTLPAVERFKRGAVVVENEARDTKLDRAGGGGEAPSTQILRYLGRAEGQSGGALRWGLLTNGRSWRLYWAQARARAEGFVELDLPELVGQTPPPVPAGAPADHWVRVFLLLFGRDALIPHGPQNLTFLDDALAQGRRYEARVTAELSEAVFNTVFPNLVAAIARHDPPARPDDAGWRAEAREAALRLLYRLLFLLYAEDRDLLPVRHSGYAGYSLQRLRDEAAGIVDEHKTLSVRATTWWPRLQALFEAIAVGDTALGLPPYNGNLFRDRPGDLMLRMSLPDAVLAPLIDAMSREGAAPSRRWINYRDLSVQQLGSIYERLLEFDVVADDGRLALRPNAFARKTTGSYYTPDELVRLILRRAVGPLLRERRDAFAAKVDALRTDRRRKPERLAQLAALDPAEAFLALRICDPAMGSGHFLVSLVDYLADETLAAVSEAPTLVEWDSYRSPLMTRVEAIRAHIVAQANTHGWPVREDQLDDRHIVRRVILKRCIYGVDLNPMAVELAKLSLWLHSFTVGAPLSFLDHHLRCGDSLFGEFAGPVERDLRDKYGLALSGAIVGARQAAAGMALVEEQTDADIAGVEASAAGFAGVEADTAPLRDFLSLYHAARWLPGNGHASEVARVALFGGSFGDPVAIAAGTPLATPRDGDTVIKRRGNGYAASEVFAAASRLAEESRALAARRRFFHWEAAFPGVWDEWLDACPRGGFDAVIGNPPWDRMKMQEVEWFAARVPGIARSPTAAERKRQIAALRRVGDPIVAEYDDASRIAEAAARVARTIGGYPLLSGGDINVYALMVERAARLVKPDGIVGVLVPSGIAADLGAAPFFRSISTSGRLGSLLDFENRRNGLGLPPFFPDVDTRFKFSTLVFGGRSRRFEAAACAFFQRDAEAAERDAFTLTPEDFAAVNPNTGTAPVFRTSRDAEITRGIYARLPVLVDRRETPPRAVWPVRYVRMFDMTNDSGKFRTTAQLRAMGAYQVRGGGWEKGDTKFVPLYEGKMVQAYDHRAASVVVNSDNLHRPAQPLPVGDLDHADPNFRPTPQFFVATTEILSHDRASAVLAFKDVTAPTNVRTMIAAMLPPAAFANTLPLLLQDDEGADGSLDWPPLLLANFNACVLDFVARQKVQGQHLNSFIVEQLPIIPRNDYARRFGPKTAEQIVRDDVLHLTYTAHDLDAFARDMGHDGPPFRWDPEDRLRRRARLDALFFLLYGLSREDAEYVMSTFPILREQEIAAHGRFRSRDLVLAYMAALEAGRPDAEVMG